MAVWFRPTPRVILYHILWLHVEPLSIAFILCSSIHGVFHSQNRIGHFQLDLRVYTEGAFQGFEALDIRSDGYYE